MPMLLLRFLIGFLPLLFLHYFSEQGSLEWFLKFQKWKLDLDQNCPTDPEHFLVSNGILNIACAPTSKISMFLLENTFKIGWIILNW